MSDNLADISLKNGYWPWGFKGIMIGLFFYKWVRILVMFLKLLIGRESNKEGIWKTSFASQPWCMGKRYTKIYKYNIQFRVAFLFTYFFLGKGTLASSEAFNILSLRALSVSVFGSLGYMGPACWVSAGFPQSFHLSSVLATWSSFLLPLGLSSVGGTNCS